MEDNKAVVTGIGLVGLTLALIAGSCGANDYYVRKAAIEKGLCQVMVPGAQSPVWSSCPK